MFLSDLYFLESVSPMDKKRHKTLDSELCSWLSFENVGISSHCFKLYT